MAGCSDRSVASYRSEPLKLAKRKTTLWFSLGSIRATVDSEPVKLSSEPLIRTGDALRSLLETAKSPRLV